MLPYVIIRFADWIADSQLRQRRTLGFASPYLLTSHFGDHSGDLWAKTEIEYETLADVFLTRPLRWYHRGVVFQCIRQPGGDVIRYNLKTEEFGVLARNNYIRTYYKPDPLVHGEATNYDYFRRECARIR